ncbi:MAG: hypothetical protein VCB42_01900 [Myxococcota bacterium]
MLNAVAPAVPFGGTDRDEARTRRSRVGVALLLVLGVCAGCASVGPTLSREAERAAGPFPGDYREVVRYWIDTELGDISSVTGLRVTKPVPGTSKPALFGRQKFGWFVRVTFRPRDTLGAAKGRARYGLLIRDRRIIASRKELY